MIGREVGNHLLMYIHVTHRNTDGSLRAKGFQPLGGYSAINTKTPIAASHEGFCWNLVFPKLRSIGLSFKMQ